MINIVPRLKRYGKTAGDDRTAYRDYQIEIGHYYLKNFVAPYAEGKKILDIGCAEGGVLEAFANHNYHCTGLEFSEHRVQYAAKKSPNSIKFLSGDIESINLELKFDVILMLDVIEHLWNKQLALENIGKLVSESGIVIISFPPFRSAFGGHQQVMSSFFQYIPFLHLLPEKIYVWMLEHIERKNVESHFRNYQTGITIKKFEQLAHQSGFKIRQKFFYFVRPRQAFRFGIKIRRYHLSILREYLSSGATYILGL